MTEAQALRAHAVVRAAFLPLALVALTSAAMGQDPPGPRPGASSRPGGPGPGGPGGFGEVELKVLARFDKDKNGRLDAPERKEARAFIREERSKAGSRPRMGPGPRVAADPPKPGPRVKLADVKSYPDADLYDPNVVRTLFLEFEEDDWEAELAEFHGTDVDVPAVLTVDGARYPGVGARFRGASSYFMIGAGSKRSLNLSLDDVDRKQRFHGVKTLNLLNANGDPTFLRSALYSAIASKYLPTPRVNVVKLVVNGESWGIYVSQEQVDSVFVKSRFGSADGVRWKVVGRPRGGGGLVYNGDDPKAYERQYEIKTEDSKDAKKGWAAFVRLCEVLEKTPAAELEAALTPILDVDGVLCFLALENVFMNEDGYWIRASDFNLFLDKKGKFHVIPHDLNETFLPVGGPGGPGGPGGRRGPGGPGGPGGPPPGFDGPPPDLPRPNGPPPGDESRPGRPRPVGVALDPLAGVGDADKPLLTKLLAVPSLKERYLRYVKTIVENDLDWSKVEPIVQRHRDRIDADVQADTRKLESHAAFVQGLGLEAPAGESRPAEGRRRPSLREFFEQRRAYLLANENLQGVKPLTEKERTPAK